MPCLQSPRRSGGSYRACGPPLDELGLKDALEGLVRSFQKRLPDVVVEFRLESVPTQTLPEAHSVVAFRLVRQALDNIAAHALGSGGSAFVSWPSRKA